MKNKEICCRSLVVFRPPVATMGARRSAPVHALALRAAALLALCGFAAAQFEQLGSAAALVNVSKPADGFSVQDKLLPCNGGLVLVDLDSDLAVNCVPPACPPQATLQKCGSAQAAVSLQNWAARAAGPGGVLTQLALAVPPPYLFQDGTCFDQGGVFNGSTPYAWHCRDPTDKAHSNQWWTISAADGHLYSNATGGKYKPGLCLAAGLPGVAPTLESGLTMQMCDSASDAQVFSYSAADGTLRHKSTNLCVDAGVIGRTVVWDEGKRTWSSKRIVPHACPDAGNPALLPRDRVGTYVVGRTAINGSAALGDRLLVIGGDDSSNNVYYSDNCGVDWFCFDGDQPWTTFGLSYAPILTLDALPGAPLILAGGLENTVSGTQSTSALYYALDGGAGTWQQGYDLPLAGVFPGSIAQDRNTVYVFGGADSGFAVWSVDESNYNTSGFVLVDGSPFAQGADVGRREFVRGSRSGGCWFATDFSPGDLWAGQRSASAAPIESSSTYFIARAATGPWTSFTAPWAPRASAAVVLARDGTRVIVAGGVDFAAGAPTGAVLTDVWAVDASVCLLSGASICAGHGTPNLEDVTCACDPAWQGDDLCSTCTVGNFGADCSGVCPSGDGFCNAGLAWGACDPTLGCVCSGQHVNGPANACDACASSFYGPSCLACPACVVANTVNGICDGSGTTGGTGKCVCLPGFVGATCAGTASSPAVSVLPPAAAATPADASAGAIAAGVLIPLALIAVGGFVLARRLAASHKPLPRAVVVASGSPVRDLTAALAPAKYAVAGASERASLLNAARAAPVRAPQQ
jgi:hypothetical protein